MLLSLWQSLSPRAPGLTSSELRTLETTLGLPIPPDLRPLLADSIPLGPDFPDWRNAASIINRVARVWEGFAFDIEHDIWLACWGPRPDTTPARLAAARAWLDAAPPLLPIYSHRYLLASANPNPTPNSPQSNPVLSIHQTDVILYADDLESYIRLELAKQPHPEHTKYTRVHLGSWHDLMESN